MSIIKKIIPKSLHKPLRQMLKFLYPKKNIATWCLDEVDISSDVIKIHGWALVTGSKPDKYTFAVNGISFETVDYPTTREDIANILWDVPDSINSGFFCQSQINKEEVFANGYATFSFINKQNKKPLDQFKNYYCPDLLKEKEFPVPDADNRIRVHGSKAELPFILEGFTNYIKIKKALKKYLGKDLSDFRRILDWGCGCGRLTRYFRYLDSVSITGVDIDEDNISWCSKNLPFGNFFGVPLLPPMSLPDLGFDLLIGVSIFTHLKEKVQFLWLEELWRISQDDAVLLMTIHGKEALTWSNVSPFRLLNLKLKGIMDAGANIDLKEIMDESDYYRNIYHHHRYIRKYWSKYFDILEIVPAYLGNIQDLVIMRKRKIKKT